MVVDRSYLPANINNSIASSILELCGNSTITHADFSHIKCIIDNLYKQLLGNISNYMLFHWFSRHIFEVYC